LPGPLLPWSTSSSKWPQALLDLLVIPAFTSVLPIFSTLYCFTVGSNLGCNFLIKGLLEVHWTSLQLQDISLRLFFVSFKGFGFEATVHVIDDGTSPPSMENIVLPVVTSSACASLPSHAFRPQQLQLPRRPDQGHRRLPRRLRRAWVCRPRRGLRVARLVQEADGCLALFVFLIVFLICRTMELVPVLLLLLFLSAPAVIAVCTVMILLGVLAAQVPRPWALSQQDHGWSHWPEAFRSENFWTIQTQSSITTS